MMNLDDYDLNDYETLDEVRELLSSLENEASIIRGYQRGAREKLELLERAAEEAEDDNDE